MTEKTLGQISYEARQDYYHAVRFQNWFETPWQNLAGHMRRAEESGAKAVASACIETAEAVNLLKDCLPSLEKAPARYQDVIIGRVRRAIELLEKTTCAS
jgi:hypothetical protein